MDVKKFYLCDMGKGNFKTTHFSIDDIKTLEKIGKTNSVFVVHAHGDNNEKIHLVKNFKNCIGTTQTKQTRRIHNFGGFTDGDRCVFLANHFKAKKIIIRSF